MWLKYWIPSEFTLFLPTSYGVQQLYWFNPVEYVIKNLSFFNQFTYYIFNHFICSLSGVEIEMWTYLWFLLIYNRFIFLKLIYYIVNIEFVVALTENFDFQSKYAVDRELWLKLNHVKVRGRPRALTEIQSRQSARSPASFDWKQPPLQKIIPIVKV